LRSPACRQAGKLDYDGYTLTTDQERCNIGDSYQLNTFMVYIRLWSFLLIAGLFFQSISSLAIYANEQGRPILLESKQTEDHVSSGFEAEVSPEEESRQAPKMVEDASVDESSDSAVFDTQREVYEKSVEEDESQPIDGKAQFESLTDEQKQKIDSVLPVLDQYPAEGVRFIIQLRDADTQQTPRIAQSADQKQVISRIQKQFKQELQKNDPSEITFESELMPVVGLEGTKETLTALAANPYVETVSVDQKRSASLFYSTERIGASIAWANGYNGNGQTIAVLDSGVDKDHPMLQGKVVAEACFSTTAPLYDAYSLCPGGVESSTAVGSGDACSTFGCEHGTHVAGIAAGAQGSTSGETFRGVANGADIIAIQVFHRDGADEGVYTFDSDMIQALEYVYSLRNSYTIAAVNMSIAGGLFYSTCDTNSSQISGEVFKTVIDSLRSAGILTVIASGNNGASSALSAPACISSSVSVGSVTSTGLDSTSDRVSTFSNGASFLDILAPGEFITSSIPGGGYLREQGTSMAAPHVAGAIALLKQKEPSLSPSEIEDRLKSTGVSITDTRNNRTFPRLAVDAALDVTDSGTGISFIDVPTTYTFYTPIMNLAEDGVVSGFEDGTFKPDQPVTRGQMAKFIKNAYGFGTDTSCGAFPDVGTDNTFYKEITTLKCRGVIGGFEDGTFKPELNVTRGQAMKFVMEGVREREGDGNYLRYTGTSQVFSDVPSSYTFYEQIMSAEENGIVGGYEDGSFGPEDETSRGAMSKMVDNARNK
jgi:subtilisin family serine protease